MLPIANYVASENNMKSPTTEQAVAYLLQVDVEDMACRCVQQWHLSHAVNTGLVLLHDSTDAPGQMDWIWYVPPQMAGPY